MTPLHLTSPLHDHIAYMSISAIVTGSASGLGRAAARRILKSGGRVVIADLGAQEALAGEILDEFGNDKVSEDG